MVCVFQPAAGPAPASVFASSLWTGDGGASKSITAPGMAAGGLVWVKSRSSAQVPDLYASPNGSTVYRGGPSGPNPMTSSGDMTFGGGGYAFTSSRNNVNAATYVGWSFARAARVCDVVTYTGNGAAGRGIAHGLGAAPGLIFVHDASDTDTGWYFYEVTDGAGSLHEMATTGAAADLTAWSNTTPTDAQFTVGASSKTNLNGTNYVAILLAHDTASDGVIQCAAFTGNGSTAGPTVTLGWQPQMVMFRNMTGAATNWAAADTARTPGFSGNEERAYPAIGQVADSGWSDAITLTASGFQVTSASADCNASGARYLAICVRA